MQEYKDAIHYLEAVAKGNPLEFAKGASPICKQICFGVLRDYYRLVYFRDSLLKKKLPAKHLDLNLLLLCGIYSICHLNRPAHASVNAVVEVTVMLKKPWAKGLVNAVMRNFQRQQKTLQGESENEPEAQLNHPTWLIDQLRDSWPDLANMIMLANNEPAPMTLRVNQAKTSVSEYQSLLEEHGYGGQPISGVPFALQLSKPAPVESLPGFTEGLVSVQDEASQLVAPLLNTEPGHRVLDACAAPGGKACHLLELQREIELTAIDKDPRRVVQIKENLDRLGFDCTLITSDFFQYSGDKFDRILLDVPCSATGIIRRHPDIKLLRDGDDIENLTATQSKLLSAAWALLEANGELVYSTCSVLLAENERIVSNFANGRDDIAVLPIDVNQGNKLEYGRQLFPQSNGHDGFYIARLKKVG
ncbi:MAG TPA: 16S rRNA (cytosine(967)-C(5))-methyltransferase [Gammaproteobacteria bacterium]|nr:16S rRNA (cytosine(967)-C(5))-methyltransferase [Gammaproteobacteria bacterium]|tara:strand:+ start:1975 stop:3228 length:1254 start_codon:yes stop_codon:yes gene_type:complete